MSVLCPLRNGAAVARAEVPVLSEPDFRSAICRWVEAGARVAALFYAPPGELWAVLAEPKQRELLLGRTAISGTSFPSLTPDLPAVHLFEREIAEQWGAVPEGHPWLGPVRFQPPRTGGDAAPIGIMDFYRVEGAEVHEVAVGPVHAGVIEPGHFRFQCHGEEVLHLEISLGYQHRGVERALVGGPNKRTIHLVETLAGDTTVAHGLAYCELVEALAGAAAPERAQALRGAALELERLANHTGDLGALANDVGWLPTASFCGRLRGDWLNLTAELCGNRFGRSFVVPGGVGFRVEPGRAERMIERGRAAMADLVPSIRLLWDTASVMSRFEETGRVERAVASALGLVGPAARACGLEVDVRVDLPAGIWRTHGVPIALWPTGDVYARAFVRALEIEGSASFVEQRLAGLPDGPARVEVGPLMADHVGVAMVEGWRGEVCHVGITGPDGRFVHYKVVDPSFHNWMGLAMAMRGQQISDFPLCNKSFNLSYCGFDL